MLNSTHTSFLAADFLGSADYLQERPPPSKFITKVVFERALRRELSHSAIGIFAALFAIMLATQLVRLLNDAVGGRIAPEAVVALLGFAALEYLPVLLNLTLFATILSSLSRQYRDSEMVIWFASGNSLFAWVLPILRFSAPVVLLIAGLTLVFTPWGIQKSIEFKRKANSRSDATYITPGSFREQFGSKRVVFVEAVDDEKGGVRGVFVRELDKGRMTIVAAAEGHKHTMENGDRFLVLDNGRRYELAPGSTELRAIEFGSYAVRIELREDYTPTQHGRHVATTELFENGDRQSTAELVRRFGMPLSALILALIAIPLSYVNPRAGRSWGVIVALLVFLIYNNMQSVMQAWVSQGKLEAIWGLWGVHSVALTLFLVMVWWQVRVSRRWWIWR